MVMELLNDEDIVKKIQSGETELYEMIIVRYQDKLYRYINRMIYSHQDSQDILQIVLIKTYTNIQSFNTKLKFSSWIYRIAHNESINWIKKNKNRYEFLESDQDINSDEKDMYQKMESEINQKLVAGCLKELDPKYKEIILLKYIEDKSYEEISDILRKPVSTVGVLINRAKSKLVEICNKHNNEKK